MYVGEWCENGLLTRPPVVVLIKACDFSLQVVSETGTNGSSPLLQPIDFKLGFILLVSIHKKMGC